MLEDIVKKSRKADIRTALDQAPKDLTKMIRHVFERLAVDPDTNKDDLNEMLGWVAYAERPLLLGELSTILKLNL